MPTTAADLVVMETEELEARLEENRRELFNLRFQLATGQLDNTSRVGHVKKDVARILTILRQRDITEEDALLAGDQGDTEPLYAPARKDFESTRGKQAEATDEADDDVELEEDGIDDDEVDEADEEES
jgi:large subunit ribosomal protein L29